MKNVINCLKEYNPVIQKTSKKVSVEEGMATNPLQPEEKVVDVSKKVEESWKKLDVLPPSLRLTKKKGLKRTMGMK